MAHLQVNLDYWVVFNTLLLIYCQAFMYFPIVVNLVISFKVN